MVTWAVGSWHDLRSWERWLTEKNVRRTEVMETENGFLMEFQVGSTSRKCHVPDVDKLSHRTSRGDSCG